MAQTKTEGIERSGSASAKELLGTMDPERCLWTLEGKTRSQAAWFLLQIAIAGYGMVRVRSGRRTLAQQQRIYGDGRTVLECQRVGVPGAYAHPGAEKRTWTLPECSKHVKGEAFDIDFGQYGKEHFSSIGEIGEECGFYWGGRWEAKDYGHFERIDA